EHLKQVEALVNSWISEHLEVLHRKMSRDEAINSGATALFGEKYGDSVRTICVGGCVVHEEEKSRSGSGISFELCGGTHVSNTSEIGLFKILSEASIGSGLRRIEAITSENILHYLDGIEELLRKSTQQLKCTSAELPQKIADLSAELKKRNQEIASQKQKAAIAGLTLTHKSDMSVFSALLDDYGMEDLRALCDVLKAKHSCSAICLLVSRDSGSDKTYMAVTVSADLQSRFQAGNILKIGLEVLGGKGGGGAAFAQGGGNSQSKAEVALVAMLSAI
ncbi:MAG: hypothetical protein LBB29_04045, partial [Holosporaceae bacterium]|nr:hypothetical protein [Holosporaceae bacterium]